MHRALVPIRGIHAVPGKGVLTGAARTCVSTPATPPGTVDTIAHFIATDIRSGVLKRGDTLPSIKTLAHTAHISRANASKAYALLESRGFLVRLGNRSMVTTARSVKSLPQPSEVIIVHQHHDIRVVMSAYDHQYPLTEMEVPGVPCPGGCFYRADK